MPAEDYFIRRMTSDEALIVVEFAAREGWNPGLNDAAYFYATDPNGFFISELDGQPVGCISAVAYGDAFGFLGLYIVRPAYRGRGYGIRLWRAAMAYMGDRNVGLDGVLAQQDNYRKSGFSLAYRHLRMTAEKLSLPDRTSAGVIALSDGDPEAVIGYDRAMFGAPRDEFIRRWVRPVFGRALGAVDGAGKLVGYGVIRACRTGFRIGPLFADDADVAETLFVSLASYARDEPVFLDVPEPNPAAGRLAKRHGMSVVFETARMYTRGEPGLPLDRIYGVTTLELG